MTTTNRLKTLIHKSVLQNLDSSALPINLGQDFADQKRFDRQRHVRIEGSVTDQSLGDPIVVIERNADTAAALQGLVLLEQLSDVDDYRGADNYRGLAARYLEEWTHSVMARLEHWPEPATIQAVIGLLVCAAVAGSYERASNPHDYLAALFEPTDSGVNPDRSPQWRDVVETAATTSRRLRPVVEAHFGEARGTGEVRTIRADRVLRIIRDFTESWRLESNDPAIDRFMRSVTPAVEVEWETLTQLATGAAPLVDPNVSWLEQMERVLDLMAAALRSGRLPDHDATVDLRALASALDDTAHRRLRDTADLVGGAPPFIERLRVVASSVPDVVAATSSFITRAGQSNVWVRERPFSAAYDGVRGREPRGCCVGRPGCGWSTCGCSKGVGEVTLFESATELHLRLEAASAADAGDELLARGRTVRDEITSAAERFEAVQSYRVEIDRTDSPSLDAKEVRLAIGRFRGAISKSGSKAFQQQPADSLLKVLASQTRRLDRWINSTWRENFAAAHRFLEQANSDQLHGSAAARRKVRVRASTIEDVLTMDPVSDRAALEARLDRRGLSACVERVNEMIAELRTAIAAIDQEQAEMSPEVQAALRRAASAGGLPLGEVTPELLAALQLAGVLDDLIVRQS